MPANGRQHGRCPADSQGKMLAPRNGGIRLCRHRGANSDGERLRSRQNVGASQRRHKALPAMGRQLGRRAEAPQGEMLAPRNGYTWLCRHWGANSVGDRPSLRVKCWRPATEIQCFAGNGAPTWPVPGPPFPVFSARGWCTNPRRPLFFRSLCTKSPDLFSARPARTWCTNPRKTLFFRSLCTKSPDLFGARPARTWCTNPRKTLFFRPLCTKSPGLFSDRPARTWCTDPRKTLFFRPLCTKSPGLFSARPAMGRQLVRLPTTGRRLESRKGEWPRPFSFSSFPQSKASGGTPEAHELLFLCSISIQSISIS